MKKLIFLLIGILFSLSTFAQQVALNSAVSIDVPKGAQKVTREQAMTHAGKKFNNNKMALDFIANTPAGIRLYKVDDDVVITLNAFDTTKINIKAGYAASLKKGLDEMAHKDPSYTSSLKTINSNTVVITNSITGNTGYCFFFCFNANNTREMTGSLVFEKADKDKATDVLNHIINSIKFKD